VSRHEKDKRQVNYTQIRYIMCLKEDNFMEFALTVRNIMQGHFTATKEIMKIL